METKKTSTLWDQVKMAQREMATWPDWMRETAKFAGEPREWEKTEHSPRESDPPKG